MRAKIVIEKNIPIPGGLAYRTLPYPFAGMEVGDSFSIPLSADQIRIRSKAITRNAATYHLREQCLRFRKRPDNVDRKFTIRELNEEGLVRCWRIA